MIQNVIRSLVLGLAFTILLSVMMLSFVSNMSRGQKEATHNLQSYLTNLRDNNMSAYIGLIAPLPIDENPGWAVPEDFTNDAGEIIARRVIGEVGEDFVCINSLGQGFTVTFYIPFTNIAFISQPAP